jgi:hypothetical protein
MDGGGSVGVAAVDEPPHDEPSNVVESDASNVGGGGGDADGDGDDNDDDRASRCVAIQDLRSFRFAGEIFVWSMRALLTTTPRFVLRVQTTTTTTTSALCVARATSMARRSRTGVARLRVDDQRRRRQHYRLERRRCAEAASRASAYGDDRSDSQAAAALSHAASLRRARRSVRDEKTTYFFRSMCAMSLTEKSVVRLFASERASSFGGVTSRSIRCAFSTYAARWTHCTRDSCCAISARCCCRHRLRHHCHRLLNWRH